jgi:hypothetical protein
MNMHHQVVLGSTPSPVHFDLRYNIPSQFKVTRRDIKIRPRILPQPFGKAGIRALGALKHQMPKYVVRGSSLRRVLAVTLRQKNLFCHR